MTMKPVSCIAALSIFSILGCSANTMVRRGEGFALNQTATLVTVSQQKLKIRNARTEEDSLVVADYHSGREIRFPFFDVEELVVRSRVKGAAEGLYLGLLIGGGLGALFGLTPAGNCGEGTAGACIFGGPVAGGALGALTGLIYGPIIGAIKGKNHIYIFPPRASTTLGKNGASRKDSP